MNIFSMWFESRINEYTLNSYDFLYKWIESQLYLSKEKHIDYRDRAVIKEPHIGNEN